MKKPLLLIIDPQNDFVDPKGTLFVKDSDKAITNLSLWIEKNYQSITRIAVSLDSHPGLHIADPEFWINDNDEHPKEFSNLSRKEINKTWFTNVNQIKMGYIPAGGIDIWPPHCKKGSWGAAIPNCLSKALRHWEINRAVYEEFYDSVVYLEKGDSSEREDYSAFSGVGFTGPCSRNMNLLEEPLYEIDTLLIAGVAKDYCVAETLKDMLRFNLLPEEVVFIEDALPAIDPNNKSLEIYQELISSIDAKYIKLRDLEEYLLDGYEEVL